MTKIVFFVALLAFIGLRLYGRFGIVPQDWVGVYSFASMTTLIVVFFAGMTIIEENFGEKS